ncbi:MAG TPA: 4-oxalocrotonate tautomerase [Gammaproteobacteria bacterium]|nr:4-oxalocrotonate tautomerase [Gammaproteobacteria bacterium]
MPFLQVNLMEGRDEQTKRELIQELTETVTRVLGSPQESIRVQLIEVPTTNWGIAGKTAKDLGR